MFHKAVELDIAEQFERAAELYELVIKEENPPVDAFLNLAVMYWRCTDLGYWASYNLDLSYVKMAQIRCREVLAEARVKLGDIPEVVFWQHYFDYINYGGEYSLSVDKALDFVTQPNSTLVPYFIIYLDSERSSEYLQKAKQLFEEVRLQKTTKNRYIISMLEGEFE
jgi:hypothetical protein